MNWERVKRPMQPATRSHIRRETPARVHQLTHSIDHVPKTPDTVEQPEDVAWSQRAD